MRDDVDELKGQTLRSSQDLVEPPGREDSEDGKHQYDPEVRPRVVV